MTDSIIKNLFDCNQCAFRMISCMYMPEEEFELIRETSNQLQFKKGEVILKQASKTTHLLFLHKGVVKMNFENNAGKNIILTIVSGPKLIGGANLFFKEQNLFSLIAVEDCDVCLFDSKTLMSLLSKNGPLLLMLLERATEMFQASIFNYISLAHKQVNGRISDVLIYLSEHVYKSNKFILSLTRKEIAEFAGCSHENVIVTLSKFNKEGIITITGKEISINDFEKLQDISKRG